MSINLAVAVTDEGWYETLRRRPNLTEVNFWAPSDSNFRALKRGELFLFKLHAPKNWIVGGGIFAHANTMPWTFAWNAFGVANGAESPEEMRERIARYRKYSGQGGGDFVIGCRILTQPFFWEESDWIAVPPDWSRTIVRLKTYCTSDSAGLSLWEAVQDRLARKPISGVAESPARYGEPTLIHPRLGQGAFRVIVTDTYGRRCAITHERTLPALEAAHIRPYSQGGGHETRNGLLLRRDIHSLFDSGYVTIDRDLRFLVSRRIREEYENGRHYYAMHGQRIAEPRRPDDRPDPALLTWHNENRFRG